MNQLSVALYIRRPKYWSFSFSISPSNEYSRLISFMIDRLDPLAVQRILNSLLQSHNSKASVLWHSAFFIAQLLHLYMNKESACNAGDLSSTPGLERSLGGRHGNPLQYSCWENPQGQRRLGGCSLWGQKESDTLRD